jgi:hypothetical protein
VDSSAVIAFPPDHAADPVEIGSGALAEIDAAIALVTSHVARRVRLTAWPFIDQVAATGLARARAAGVGFTVERADRAGVVTVTVGPLE